MKFHEIFIYLFICILLCSVAYGDGNDDLNSANARFKLPKIFDWSQYKIAFNKVYPSIKDEIARNKLFVANALKTFLHNISFKMGKSSYFLSVNQFTDNTLDELRQLYSGFNVEDIPKVKESVDNSLKYDDEEQTMGLDVDKLKEELERVIEQKQPGYEILAQELQVKMDKTKPPKRSFIRAPSLLEKNSQLIGHQAANNNEFNLEKMADDFMNSFNFLNQVPPIKFVQDQLDKVFGKKNSNDNKQKLIMPRTVRVKQPDSVVYVDWRESQCLTVPRDQKKCRSCYAFATVAMMEWAHCNQTGKLVPFSEQYMIDCGKHNKLGGCKGGNIPGMGAFMMDWGVELRYNRPYKAEDSSCPYEKHEWERGGFLKPVIKSFTMAQNMSEWSKLLKKNGPFIVILILPKDFYYYGGKVHSGHNCDGSKEIHAVLLVGHGVEHGQEYWLFRNSHGYKWGELGYFKLARYATSGCYFQANLVEVDFINKIPSTKQFSIEEDDGNGKRQMTLSEAYTNNLFKEHGPYQLERSKFLAYNSDKR